MFFNCSVNVVGIAARQVAVDSRRRVIRCVKDNQDSSRTVNLEARCSAVISALTGVFPRVFGLEGSDGQGNDSLPLFHHVFISGPDAFITFIPEEVDARQRVFTGQS